MAGLVQRARRLAVIVSLAGEILTSYARVRRSLSARGLLGAVETARASRPRRGLSSATMEPRRLARAVDRALTPLPVDSRCLMSSLVLTALLARRAITSSLVIGVRPGERFGAHAWVELGGAPVAPTGEEPFGRLVVL